MVAVADTVSVDCLTQAVTRVGTGAHLSSGGDVAAMKGAAAVVCRWVLLLSKVMKELASKPVYKNQYGEVSKGVAAVVASLFELITDKVRMPASA